jgi:hypothetical protein
MLIKILTEFTTIWHYSGIPLNKKWEVFMFNNYFISPTNHSNSIYLTYHKNQPFASLGSKTPVPGVTSVCLPSAPPEDDQPRGLISEFLRVNSDSSIGKKGERTWIRKEAGPTGKRQNLYRMNPRSYYTEPRLDWLLVRWDHTKRETMIPNYKTVSMWDNIYRPGASTSGSSMDNDMVCHMLEGELTVNTGSGDNLYKKGDVWSCAKGMPERSKNTGSTVAIMRVIDLLPP